MEKPRKTEDRIDLFISAWQENAANATLAGMTLDQFKAAVAPSLTVRDEIEALDNQMTGAIARRTAADEMSAGIMQRVVHAILGDPAFGPDCALYRALHYVPKSERRSGLTRKSAAAPSQSTDTPAK
jgi:hypothetical protein